MTRQNICKCFERRSEIARTIAHARSEDLRTATNLERSEVLRTFSCKTVVHDVATVIGSLVPNGLAICCTHRRTPLDHQEEDTIVDRATYPPVSPPLLPSSSC